MLFVAAESQAATEMKKRVALVIGNSHYLHAVALPNPANDADLISDALRKVDFEVIKGVDLNKADMTAIVDRFTDAAYEADIALIYFAGHGMQVDGKNYMIPVDAQLTAPSHLKTRAIQVDDFIEALPADPAVGIVILDACRDNPLARAFAQTLPASRSGSLGTGLASVQAIPQGAGTGGLLIAYATDPGAVAMDGKGANSPYTTALAKYLVMPGLELQSALTRVRGQVADVTLGRQRPWHNASLGREVFVGGPALETVILGPASKDSAESAPNWEIEQRVWDEASKRNTLAHYEAYLAQYPHGNFVTLARINIDQLKTAARAPSIEDQPATASGEPRSAPVETASDIGTELTENALRLTRADRIDLQERLNAIGLKAGPADGFLGNKTRQAIKSWQAEKVYADTTFLTSEQLARLKLETEQQVMAMREQQARDKETRKTRPGVQATAPAPKAEVKQATQTRRANVSKGLTGTDDDSGASAKPRKTKPKAFRTCHTVRGDVEIPADQRCQIGW